ncbi:MAG: ATP-binding protein [Pseudomonadota bacterium]
MILINPQQKNANLVGYQLGGIDCVSRGQIAGLDAFETKLSEGVNLPDTFEQTSYLESLLESDRDSRISLQYESVVPIAGKNRHLRYFRNDQYGYFECDEDRLFALDLSAHIVVSKNTEINSQQSLELFLGPCLVLLFAELGRYLFHAAAIETPFGLIGVMAESGVGKSTLSAHESALVAQQWNQVGDDCLVVDGTNLRAYPRFPQLKLDRFMSKFCEASSLVEDIRALVRLERRFGDESDSVVTTHLDPEHAILEVVRHTVGGKLFAGDELAKHLAFAARLANAVPVINCSMPDNKNALDNVALKILGVLHESK